MRARRSRGSAPRDAALGWSECGLDPRVARTSRRPTGIATRRDRPGERRRLRCPGHSTLLQRADRSAAAGSRPCQTRTSKPSRSHPLPASPTRPRRSIRLTMPPRRRPRAARCSRWSSRSTPSCRISKRPPASPHPTPPARRAAHRRRDACRIVPSRPRSTSARVRVVRAGRSPGRRAGGGLRAHGVRVNLSEHYLFHLSKAHENHVGGGIHSLVGFQGSADIVHHLSYWAVP